MKGLGRSVYYWLYNLEKTFVIMFATISAIVAFQVLVNGGDLSAVMPQMYIPMIGSIMLIAMFMNNAVHFIPQSLSYGGTRKDVFMGMEIAIHLMMMQWMLLVIIGMFIMPADFFSADFFKQCLSIYLACCGLGNLLCAGSLKYGAKIGMILYIIFVVAASIFIGVFFALSANNIVEYMSNGASYFAVLLAAVLLDGIMIAICYFAIRKYEVR